MFCSPGLRNIVRILIQLTGFVFDFSRTHSLFFVSLSYSFTHFSKQLFLQTSGQSNVSLVIKDQSPDSKALKLIGDSLLATRSLDFETQSSYNVTIIATDSGNPPLRTSLTVTIEVKTMFNDSLSLVLYPQ